MCDAYDVLLCIETRDDRVAGSGIVLLQDLAVAALTRGVQLQCSQFQHGFTLPGL